MILGLVVQSNKCGDMWQQLFLGWGVISLQLKLLESTALTTVWSVARIRGLIGCKDC